MNEEAIACPHCKCQALIINETFRSKDTYPRSVWHRVLCSACNKQFHIGFIQYNHDGEPRMYVSQVVELFKRM